MFLRKGVGYAKFRHPKFITLTIEITSIQMCSQGMLGDRYILVIKQKSTEGKEIEDEKNRSKLGLQEGIGKSFE